jgi:PIN domain nuclease of toxin-antitoxin system
LKVLLDTCTFLWICAEPEKLSNDARQSYSDPDTEVYLSSVSCWEIAVKYSRGRLLLAEPPARFIAEQRAQHGIKSLPLDEESALHAARLPKFHADPFDRLLVCQAIVHGLAVLTPDILISQYPVRIVW